MGWTILRLEVVVMPNVPGIVMSGGTIVPVIVPAAGPAVEGVEGVEAGGNTKIVDGEFTKKTAFCAVVPPMVRPHPSFPRLRRRDNTTAEMASV